MENIRRFLAYSWVFIFLFACEKDLSVIVPEQEAQIVVEGYIENDLPPFVFLSKSQSYNSTFSLESYQNSFIKNAKIQVSNGTKTIDLIEIPIDTGGVRIYVYTSPTFEMIGEPGKTYWLNIEAEGKTLTAVTKIPEIVPLDSVWWEPAKDPEKDSLVTVKGRIDDPDTLGNFYRILTKRNSEAFFADLNSVYDDKFANGSAFDFPINRGEDKYSDEDRDLATYGYFWHSDTVIVRWSCIDKRTFEFWRTLEFDFNSTGNPFSAPTFVKTNINGGLGTWSGYATSYDTLYIPEK